MKKLFARFSPSSRVMIALGATLLVGAGLLLVLAFLQPQSAAPEAETAVDTAQPTTAVPASPTPQPSSAATPVIASVNGYTITEEYLEHATALNRVLSELAGQEPLGESETLQRLIKQQLVLQGAPVENEPTDADVEDYIVRMQQSWNVEEDTMMSELEAAGVERAFLEETIHRLLTVDVATRLLGNEGENINRWLGKQQQEADIKIYRDLSGSSSDGSESEPTATPPPPTESAEELPVSTPSVQPSVPEIAADFTLDQAGGGTLSLSDQLKEGPVVLVFFQKCG